MRQITFVCRFWPAYMVIDNIMEMCTMERAELLRYSMWNS